MCGQCPLRQRKVHPADQASDAGMVIEKENTMHALRDFFTTDYGLFSAVVIAITLGMGVWYARFFAVNIKRDTARAAAEATEAAN